MYETVKKYAGNAEAVRKLKDTALLKGIRRNSQVSVDEFVKSLDKTLKDKIKTKTDVFDYIHKHGINAVDI